MHPILKRHLDKLRLNEHAAPATSDQWAAFIAVIDRSFARFDSDRQLQDRSLTIASEEMAALYASLSAQNENLERLVSERTAQLHAALQNANAINADLISAKVAAEDASRTKSEFLAQMSHEIRSPLTAILGYSDILRNDRHTDNSPDQRRHALDVIHSTGQHLLTVLSDILDLSMVEAGRLVINKAETDLPSLLAEVQTLLRPRADEKKIGFALRLASPIPQQIVTDPTRLRQMLVNLAGNAIKFTQAGEVKVSVLVRAGNDFPRLVIDIEDTGCGMTPSQQARIFNAFTQGDASITRTHGGTGLGLIISRRLANLIGGDVSLVRSAPGLGSCFRMDISLDPVLGSPMISKLPGIELPSAGVAMPTSPGHGQTQPVSPAAVPSDGPLRGRLLLVDDDKHIREIVRLYLRRAGAEVDIAENGQIALDLVRAAQQENRPYELVVTDMQMPVMDGYTLATTLRERGSTVAIVALTAHAMSTESDKCLAAGCDAYATKPVDKAALIRICTQWMGRTSNHTRLAKAT